MVTAKTPEEWKKEAEARREAEMSMGRKRNLITSMEALMLAIKNDYDIKARLMLNHEPDSFEDWQVIAIMNDGTQIFEAWREFPSEEFRTKLMLLGVM